VVAAQAEVGKKTNEVPMAAVVQGQGRLPQGTCQSGWPDCGPACQRPGRQVLRADDVRAYHD
jgi:hypothetical protein